MKGQLKEFSYIKTSPSLENASPAHNFCFFLTHKQTRETWLPTCSCFIFEIKLSSYLPSTKTANYNSLLLLSEKCAHATAFLHRVAIGDMLTCFVSLCSSTQFEPRCSSLTFHCIFFPHYFGKRCSGDTPRLRCSFFSPDF